MNFRVRYQQPVSEEFAYNHHHALLSHVLKVNVCGGNSVSGRHVISMHYRQNCCFGPYEDTSFEYMTADKPKIKLFFERNSFVYIGQSDL